MQSNSEIPSGLTVQHMRNYTDRRQSDAIYRAQYGTELEGLIKLEEIPQFIRRNPALFADSTLDVFEPHLTFKCGEIEQPNRGSILLNYMPAIRKNVIAEIDRELKPWFKGAALPKNVAIAGGYVCSSLNYAILNYNGKYNGAGRDRLYGNCDIDIFSKDNLTFTKPPFNVVDCLSIRTSRSITCICEKNGERPLQYVLGKYHTLSSLLYTFDIPIVAVAYSKGEIYMTYEAVFETYHQAIVASANRISINYDRRLYKYCNKCINIIIPRYFARPKNSAHFKKNKTGRSEDTRTRYSKFGGSRRRFMEDAKCAELMKLIYNVRKEQNLRKKTKKSRFESGEVESDEEGDDQDPVSYLSVSEKAVEKKAVVKPALCDTFEMSRLISECTSRLLKVSLDKTKTISDPRSHPPFPVTQKQEGVDYLIKLFKSKEVPEDEESMYKDGNDQDYATFKGNVTGLFNRFNTSKVISYEGISYDGKYDNGTLYEIYRMLYINATCDFSKILHRVHKGESAYMKKALKSEKNMVFFSLKARKEFMDRIMAVNIGPISPDYTIYEMRAAAVAPVEERRKIWDGYATHYEPWAPFPKYIMLLVLHYAYGNAVM